MKCLLLYPYPCAAQAGARRLCKYRLVRQQRGEGECDQARLTEGSADSRGASVREGERQGLQRQGEVDEGAPLHGLSIPAPDEHATVTVRRQQAQSGRTKQ